MNTLNHSLWMTLRHVRGLLRQPWYIAFTLVQPVIWLLLYGQLFQRVVELPGFHTTSYVSFLTPGVIIMTALMSGGWNGMSIIIEIDRGVMDRFLVSPVSRFALVSGRLIFLGFIVIVQSLMLALLGLALGAHLEGGWLGWFVLILASVLLGAAFGALSNAMAIIVRKPESVIGAANFILLPLTFLSPVFMATDVMPEWIRNFSRYNPVAWGVESARGALSSHPDWGFIGVRLALLLAFATIASVLATRAFRAYQRSV